MSVHSISLENVTVSFGGETILMDLSLKLEGPTLIQIIGPNGAGKTTLLKVILGLIRPERGKVKIDYRDVTAMPEEVGKIVGYVPQIVPTKVEMPITAKEFVLNSLLLHTRRFPRLFVRREEMERVEEVLRLVDLHEWEKRFSDLSGGERQRALLARALVYDPPILLLDEPLSAVDPLGKVELAELIGRLAKDKLILVTSHDPILLLPYTEKIILLNRGYCAVGTPDEILRVEVLKDVYGESAILLEEHVHISDEH